ncbi:MAG TPA: hemerythrin domain-containing protein [Oxalicibacterium sp.]
MTKSVSAPNAVDLLIQDHEKVKKLFKEYERLAKKGDTEGKQEVATHICEELTVHTQIEEEIFYPAAKAALDEKELVNEAAIEHASAKILIDQIKKTSPKDEMYDALLKVLSEYVDHHVKEEETEMFPKAKKAKLDMNALGARMMERKEALLSVTA